MDYLVFQLQAPLSSWGEPAVGEFRPSAAWPSQSALQGLLAAALGIERENSADLQALHNGYVMAVGVVSVGNLLRDYHTAQVPSRSALKGRPHHTRYDELNMPKHELNTVLSTRDYRQNSSYVVAVEATPTAPHTLLELCEALRRPRFALYLGRKACPLAAPLAPQCISAAHVREAFDRFLQNKSPVTTLQRMAWASGMQSGVKEDFSVPRKDRVLSRDGWQFGDRVEYVAVIGGQ